MADKGKTNKDTQARPNWLAWGFIALTVLILLLGLAFLVSGKEIIERPFLILFLLLAWFGLLAGIAIGRSSE